MGRLLALAAALHAGAAGADSIHARPDASYWHHDSGWVFPEKIGEFGLVGVPQDVAGSRDAVAWYARVADGVRTVASVELIAPDSAAENATPSTARRMFESGLPAGSERVADDATRIAYLVTRDGERQLLALYLATVGEWRVRIRATLPRPDDAALERLDAFVHDQRWDSLPASVSIAASTSCAAAAGA